MLAVVGAGVDAATVAACVALDWVVLGDATAQGALAYFDPLLRDDGFAAAMRPDLVVRLGGLPASRVLAERLRDVGRAPVVALRGAGRVADPDGVVAETSAGRPDAASANLRGSARLRARRGERRPSGSDEWLERARPRGRPARASRAWRARWWR